MSIELSDVTKRFGRDAAIDGVSAQIADGEFFVVLGPSGCGKSTLLRAIAGLERLDGGEIALDGRQVSGPDLHVAPEDRAVGVVFQSYALWPHMNVRDNVAFPAEASGMRRKSSRAVADGHLATVDLTDFADRFPAALSGGQRQRVALARCLAGGARTILMDEPLANLDPHLRGRMEAEIAAFHRAAQVTTIYITHDQREAMALADRIAVLEAGRVLQVGPPQQIHDRPASEQVARFIGRAAVLDAHVSDGQAVLGPLQAGLDAPDGPARVVIRPGDVALGGPEAEARLGSVFYRGGSWEGLAHMDGVDEPLPVVSATRLNEGETVPVSLRSAWSLPG